MPNRDLKVGTYLLLNGLTLTATLTDDAMMMMMMMSWSLNQSVLVINGGSRTEKGRCSLNDKQ